jgi:hypothetical protein
VYQEQSSSLAASPLPAPLCLLTNAAPSRDRLTFLSHFAFALAQCTQAMGIRSVGESMTGGLLEFRRKWGQCAGVPADGSEGRVLLFVCRWLEA